MRCKLRKEIGARIIYKKENIVVSFPKDQDIDYTYLEAIAIEQLGISWWEFDYLLGEHGITPNSL